MNSVMPRPPRLKPTPIRLRDRTTLGQRITRLRKQRGYTQTELAQKMGSIQALVSDYERNKLRPHAEMVIRFAQALDISTDQLLGLEKAKDNGATKNRRLLRRLHQIDKLPKRDQDALIRTIDAFLGKAS